VKFGSHIGDPMSKGIVTLGIKAAILWEWSDVRVLLSSLHPEL
jgi:hypothetical protein